jgi:hypothetical protein
VYLLGRAVYATTVPAKSIEALFIVHVRRFEANIGGHYGEAKKLLPEDLRSDGCWLSMVIEHVSNYVRSILEEGIKAEFERPRRKRKRSSDELDPLNHVGVFGKMQVVVGWAIDDVYGSLLKETNKRSQSYQRLGSSSSIKMAQKFLLSLTISHWEALRDAGYVASFYPPYLLMQNRGALKLIHRSIIPWARKLIEECIRKFSIERVHDEGQESMQNAIVDVVESSTLQAKFLECISSTEFVKEMDEKSIGFLYKEISKKVFHAMSGRETGRIKQKYLGHQSKEKKTGDASFRGEMKVQEGNKAKKMKAPKKVPRKG